MVNFLLLMEKMSHHKGIPVLQYHRISNDFDAELHTATVKSEEFEWQMDFLKLNGYNVITPSEAMLYLKEGITLSDKYVTITFDDGHYDNFEFAYPILKARGLCATVFIITDYVGKQGWFNKNGAVKGEIDGTERYYEFMSWKDLNSISDVFTIGSHGRTHRDLTTLSDDELETELFESKQAIFNNIGVYPDFFCYPYGEYNKKVADFVCKAGYLAAFSSDYGINNSESNYYLLKRNAVGMGITPKQFKLLLTERIRTYQRYSAIANMTPYFN